ncbi:MAG: hypothetical protein ACP5VP_12320 [Candidatus Limnocylindrales bacterium]
MSRSEARAYPLARFDPPQLAEGYSFPTWFRYFRCGACGTTLGRQRIGQTVRVDQASGDRVPDYRLERVELHPDLIYLSEQRDGLYSFGLPARAYTEPSAPPGVTRRSLLRHHRATLPSVSRHNPYEAPRHEAQEARTPPSGGWVLALTTPDGIDPLPFDGLDVTRPFVVTCVKCRRRWLVAGRPSDAELRAASTAV